MWKPANPPTANPKPSTPELEKQQVMSTTNTLPTEPSPISAPRNAVLNNQEQATIGKSLVIKGEGTASESLYIDGRLEATLNPPPNHFTIRPTPPLTPNITPP